MILKNKKMIAESQKKMSAFEIYDTDFEMRSAATRKTPYAEKLPIFQRNKSSFPDIR